MSKQYIRNACLSYPGQAQDNLLVAPSNQQVLLQSIAAYNNSATAVDAACCVKPNPALNLFFNGSGAPLTLPGSIFTSNGDRLIIQCPKKFHLVSFLLSQAQASVLTFTTEYWNGSAWTAVPGVLRSPVATSTGEDALAFFEPIAWVVGTAGEGSTRSDYYSIRLTLTAAPSQAIQGAKPQLAYFLAYRNLSSKNFLQVIFLKDLECLLEAAEAVSVYFATAGATNSAELTYRINP